MSDCSTFWDVLARFHSEIEDTNFDLASVRRLRPQIESPVLVVGAGQGLIVEELRKWGQECDGVDLSSEMIRQANLRRGINLIQADAKGLPMSAAQYETVIYATGVVDFTADDADIKSMLGEGRRVVRKSGKVFVAFYKASAAQEAFLERIGLIRGTQLAFRESLKVHMVRPHEMVGWVAKSANLSFFHAFLALLRVATGLSMHELRNTLKMQRVFRKIDDPWALINAAPETMPYRNAIEIGNLFKRLGIPIHQLSEYASCRVVRI